MVSAILRHCAALLGYLLYTVLVFLLLAWLLFPDDRVKDWCVRQLENRYPGTEWTITSLGLELPAGLVMKGVRAKTAGAKEPFLHFSRFSLQPDPLPLLNRQPAARYLARVSGGELRGTINWSSDWKTYRLLGKIEGVQLGKLAYFNLELQRGLDGVLRGSFSGTGDWAAFPAGEYQGTLRVEGGTLRFRAPVLGMDELAYNVLAAGFHFKDGSWQFDEGSLDSPLLSGSFNGSLNFGMNLATSGLQFTGVLKPRPEMFAGAENRKLAGIIRPHLKEGGLQFTVSGTAAAPGIRFSGALARSLQSLSGERKKP